MMKKLFIIGAVVLCAHIAGVSHVTAEDNISLAVETPKGISISEFLTPDGRFDLEAARQSGYQGSLDIKGFQSVIDPATGQPIFRPSETGDSPLRDNPDDIYWDNSISAMPLAFTRNNGQWPDSVLFRADAGGATMWITTEGVYYQFTRCIDSGARNPRGFDDEPDSIETMIIKAAFVGANPSPTASGGNLMEYKCNYFLGNEPSKWRTDVPNYETITLEEVYPGIDLIYYGNGKQMEYDFVVSPGADYSQIRIQCEGTEGLAVADDGALVVKTKWGGIRELAPVVYQEIGGTRRPVASEYVVQSDHTFGFRLGAEFDSSLPVVIDPVLVYSTYLGGSAFDRGYDIAADKYRNYYITGHTFSANFPCANPYDPSYNGGYGDAFVTKISAAGDRILYSTFIGGDGYEAAISIAVDSN